MLGGAPFGIATGTLDVPAGLEKEMDVSLVGEHRGGPPVAVGLPPFVFPFDPTEASLGGGGADGGQVFAGRCGREVGTSRAGVGGEPVVHAMLEFCLCIIIFEDIGDFALAAVVEGGCWCTTGKRGPLGCGRRSYGGGGGLRRCGVQR